MIRIHFKWVALSLLLASASALQAQAASGTISIQVHADHVTGSLQPVWNFFGYDEPNYTYATNGKKLLDEIGGLGSTPAYIRAHNLFTSGNGEGSPKWGSTNVYTEDASGKPVYDWKIIDRIFDTYRDAGVKPL